jgi:hypothetical protein
LDILFLISFACLAELAKAKETALIFFARCAAQRYFVEDPAEYCLERESAKIRIETHFSKFSYEKYAH